MSKISQMFASKTFWAIVVMFATYTLNTFGHYLSPSAVTLITGILSAIAVYFKINSNTIYTSQGVNPPASGEKVTLVQP